MNRHVLTNVFCSINTDSSAVKFYTNSGKLYQICKYLNHCFNIAGDIWDRLCGDRWYRPLQEYNVEQQREDASSDQERDVEARSRGQPWGLHAGSGPARQR